VQNLIVVIFAITLGSASLAARQSSATEPKVDDLVGVLHSAQWTERAAAFEQLRHNPSALRDQRVQVALWALGDYENHPAPTDSRAESSRDEEAYAEYNDQLFETLESIVNWNDPGQVCILAHAPYNDDSPFAADLANAGRIIVPCLMQMAASSNAGNRMESIAVMIQIRAKKNVDAATGEKLKSIVISALHDPDRDIRANAVDALRAFGGEDMISALQQVAETDPAPEFQGVSIRTTARSAIAAIQRRSKAGK
jgi:hypothetical protein